VPTARFTDLASKISETSAFGTNELLIIRINFPYVALKQEVVSSSLTA
jgi:hypothetical protein